MTAVIHHGSPGSYKSFGVLQCKAIPALREGRTVITNVRGFDSLERVEEALGEVLHVDARIIYLPHDNQGFKDMATFYHWAPIGALIFMDEAQRVYPTRLKKLDSFDFIGGPDAAEEAGRPSTIENAFDQHRHYNWDIYLTTPNIAKIHKEIRQVAEWAYRHRNLSGLTFLHKDKWKEVKHDAENSGKSTTHGIGGAKEYRADSRYFKCYQSTATGVAKESDDISPIHKEPRLVLLGFVLLCAIAYLFYGFSELDEASPSVSSGDPVPVQEVVTSSVDDSSNDGLYSVPQISGNGANDIVTVSPDLMTYDVVYKGFIANKHLLEFTIDDSHYLMNSTDLAKLGIRTQVLSDCLLSMRKGQQRRIIMCSPREAQRESEAMRAVPVAAPIGVIADNSSDHGRSDRRGGVILIPEHKPFEERF